MFNELTNEEMVNVDGGSVLVIAVCCVIGGSLAGAGIVAIASKIFSFGSKRR